MTATDAEALPRRRRWPLIGFILSGVLALVAMPIGLLVTVAGLTSAFESVESPNVDPSERARVVSEGIALSTNATMIGTVVAVLAACAAAAFGTVVFLDWRRSKR